MSDRVSGETMLAGLHVEDGSAVADVRPPHELVVAMAKAMAESLGDAPNYRETEFAPSVSVDVHAAEDPEWYVLTVQRKHGKTPAQLRAAAEAERDEARSEAERLRKENREHEQRAELLRQQVEDLTRERDEAAAEVDRLDAQLASRADVVVREVDGRLVVEWPSGRGRVTAEPEVVEGWAEQANTLRAEVSRLTRQIAITKAHYQRRCTNLTTARDIARAALDAVTAERDLECGAVAKLQGLLHEALRTIGRLCEALPATCQYHGTAVERPDGRACCDTGRPTLLRRQAARLGERIEREAGLT